MKPRAYLQDRDEFYYPEDNTPKSLAEFYSVLEGYRRKGREFEITWSVGVVDDMGLDIYSGDIVMITDTGNTIYSEKGVVEFTIGAYVVINKNGLLYDFEDISGMQGDDTFSIQVVSNIYKQKKENV